MLLLHKLKQTSSRIEKEALLRTADTFDKKVFHYAYNQNQTYGVKFNNINWKNVRQAEQTTFILLDQLATRELTGNLAREQLDKHIAQHGDLIKLICNQDLDCGVTATTLNKVFGKGFVPQFKVQLAVEVPIDKCPLPCIGQLKYNGVRVVALINNQGVTFKTRNGKEFEYPILAEKLLKSREYAATDFVFDGELSFGDSQGTNHTKVSGIVNSAIHGSPIRQKLHYNVFDSMPMNTFLNQDETLPYISRFGDAQAIIAELDEDLVRAAETYEFYKHEDIEAKFSDMLAKGYEGLILKTWRHKYGYKRSKDWIKLKAVKTADLKVIGINDGTGKYEGGIGSLICHGQVEGKHIEVDVGSGLDDEKRMHSELSSWIGDTIEVKYNEVIRNKEDNGWTLFLPRFVTVRGDL